MADKPAISPPATKKKKKRNLIADVYIPLSGRPPIRADVGEVPDWKDAPVPPPPDLYRPPDWVDPERRLSLAVGMAEEGINPLQVLEALDAPRRGIMKSMTGVTEADTGSPFVDFFANAAFDPFILASPAKQLLKAPALIAKAKPGAGLLRKALGLKPKPRAFGFVSPSITETTLDRSFQSLTSQSQAAFRSMADDMVKNSGLKGSTFSGIGDSSIYGTEPTIGIIFDEFVSQQHMDALLAGLGRQGDQMATMSFIPSWGGKGVLYKMEIPADMREAIDSLAKAGVHSRTVSQTKKGTMVMVYDDLTDPDVAKGVLSVGEKYGITEIDSFKGTAKFVGSETSRIEGLRGFIAAQDAFRGQNLGSKLSEGLLGLANRSLRLLGEEGGRLSLTAPNLDIIGAGVLAATRSYPRWRREILKELSPRMDVSGLDLESIFKASQKILTRTIQSTTEGKLPSAARLNTVYHRGKGLQEWYDNFAGEIKDVFGPDAEIFTKMVAATSVLNPTPSNAVDALIAYRAWKTGAEFKGLPAVTGNLERAVAGQPLSGPKVTNFFKNLSGDPNAVTVDRWMMRLFDFKSDSPTPRQYDLIDAVVTRSAREAGVTPRQYQAALWAGVRSESMSGETTSTMESLIRSALKDTPELKALRTELKTGLPAPGTVQSVLRRFLEDQRGSVMSSYFGLDPGGTYPKMSRVLEQKLPGSGTPAQFQEAIAAFSRKGEFKPDELKWSGLEEWLAGINSPKIDKGQVMRYLQSNNLRVENLDVPQVRASASDYAKWTESGGTNYQEIMLTLPDIPGEYSSPHFGAKNIVAHVRTKDRVSAGGKSLFIEEIQSDWHQAGRTKGYRSRGQMKELEEVQLRDLKAQALLEEVRDRVGASGPVHLERNLGITVRQIERAQRDLKDLRRRAAGGTQQNLPGILPEHRAVAQRQAKKWLKEGEEALKELEAKAAKQVKDLEEITKVHEEALSARADIQGMRDDVKSSPPEAPFAKTWPELALKRMIKKAADEGYDSVSWTTGLQQAERYNLSKKVESVQYFTPAAGVREGTTLKKNEILLRFKTFDMQTVDQTVTDAQLGDWVGAKIADRIRKGKGTGTIEGPELDIGGEHLKFFYDKELPRAANKLVKKFGGKVEMASMGLTEAVYAWPRYRIKFRSWVREEIKAQIKATRVRDVPGADITDDLNRLKNLRSATESMHNAPLSIMEEYATASPDEVVWKIFNSEHAGYTTKAEALSQGGGKNVHTIKITPSMRTAIEKEGFPLFDILLGTTTGAAAGAAGAAKVMSSHEQQALPPPPEIR